MVTVLKAGSDKETIQSVWQQLREKPPRRSLDAYKYCGTVRFKEDGLVLQKRWRDEWQ
ncbi:hypothetical protein [Tunicatimonas pelagia]|uniref:hypothetical protein n=1 Tax=Tunicatimonas pelagia TaxID=931531 RepID=UPI00266621EC|nr:hypothetical protein [Tunicatimonas pelagia]WKN42869.1 hypothetical protein P0M28_27920 [Tunicatimonas pelagia]